MERGDYWSALVRGWWLIAILGLVGLAVGLLLPKASTVGTTHWESTSSIGSAPPAQDGSLFGGGISTDQILYYSSTDQVMIDTAKLAGLGWPPWLVRDAITLVGPSTSGSSSGTGNPGIIDVTVAAPTSAQALTLNNAYDEAMQLEINAVATQSLLGAEKQTETTLATIENQIATNTYAPGLSAAALEVQVAALQSHLAQLVVEQPGSGFQVLQAPSAVSLTKVITTSKFSSRPLRAAAGLVIGLVVGALLALALWLLDKRLKTAKRAQVAFGYPVVAEIPTDSSDSTEPYRMLWLSVFREPLPLPPSEQNERLYEGEDPVLDSGVGSRAGRPGTL